jgi:osmotically-inducible protein OsmY
VKRHSIVIGWTLFLTFAFLCAGSLKAADQPKDELITLWVKEALRADPRIDTARIEVSIDSGIVHLAGQVPDLVSRKYADLEAKKITGVRGVINEIIVFAPTRSDTDIAQNLRRAFLSSSDIRLRDTGVRVKDGRVTLTGQMDSWDHVAEAELIATELRGVKAVKNDLKVVSMKSRPDKEVRQDVIDAFGRDVYLLGRLLDAQVHQGVVTLTGKVATPYQKERATLDCLSVVNVKEVKNYLDVGAAGDVGVRKKAPAPSDEELGNSVRAELYQDLRVVGPNEIDVEAASGHVVLRGTVPSFSQKRLATRDAQEVVGVIWVSNLLSVDTEWREDEKLREDIRFALDSDSTLAGWDIRIRVTQGVVTLSGNVKSPYQKEHATEVASRILGVRDVLNDLEVSRLDKYSDTALVERLRSRLKADWETHSVAGKIDIKAKNGIATLSGEVNTWSEYKEAARAASLTDGVWEVVNRLRVVGVDYPWIRY